MLAEVSAKHVKEYVDTLAGFGTRHTLSETDSPTRGIGATRRWIKSKMSEFSAESGRSGDDGLQVSFDTYVKPPGENRIRTGDLVKFTRNTDITNVMAVLPGSMPEARNRLYYVTAHYDSRATINMDAKTDAPGANDNASGTAVVLELARVMSRHRFDATLVFVAFAGEEQGLIGSTLHVEKAQAEGKDIRAVLNNDVVGDPGRFPRGIRVFSEGLVSKSLDPEEQRLLVAQGTETESLSRQLARYVSQVASWHKLTLAPKLIFRRDRFLKGSDHIAFNIRGYAAVRMSVVEENYDRQHQDQRVENGVQFGDLASYVDGDYVANVAELNMAVLTHLANAPSTPNSVRLITASLSNDTTIRWTPSPEPDVAGYEIVWRDTTSSHWQHIEDVGGVTEATVPVNKDNVLFGLRAYDNQGYRSPIAIPTASKK